MRLSAFVTVAGPQDLASVLVLRQALRLHHPGATLTVVARPGAVSALTAMADVDVVTPAALLAAEPGPPDAAVGPAALEHLLGAGREAALLLPPDADVRAPLETVEQALDRADVVLVPRVDGRLPDDGLRPDVHDLLVHGEVDHEIVAVRRSPAAGRFLAWWVDETLEEGGRSPAAVLRAAQLGLDGIELLRDPGTGAGAWNLHSRALTRDPDGTVRTGGVPLRLLRFAAFRPDRPWWLSAEASRVRVLDDPVLIGLCRERAAALLAAGWAPPAAAADGLRRDERLQRLALEAADAGVGSAAEDDQALLDWATGRAQAPGAGGVTRYGYAVWRDRGDLQLAFPDLDGPDAERFGEWLRTHGRAELGLDERLVLPPPPADGAQDGSPARPARPPVPAGPSVEVAGYLDSALGLGQAARGYVTALRAAGVPTATTSVTPDVPGPRRRGGPTEPDRRDGTPPVEGRAGAVLVCVNPPELPGLLSRLEPDWLDGRPVIGQWAWEIDVVPASWTPAFALVDELWVYSHHVADILAAVSPVPVVVMPPAVQAPPGRPVPSGMLPPGEAFTFLVLFDPLSTVERKNPLGAIAAFRRAFADGEGPRLLVKTTGGDRRPEVLERLRHAAGGRSDITIVDAMLSRERLWGLLHEADCLVSLHRSEGFGLPLAEAMAIGRPVVATGFGGNLDFMDATTAHLVGSRPVRVGPDCGHYPADGTWAEPSVEEAAGLLRAVWSEPRATGAMAERGRLRVREQLAPETVGVRLRRRLEHLADRRTRPA